MHLAERATENSPCKLKAGLHAMGPDEACNAMHGESMPKGRAAFAISGLITASHLPFRIGARPGQEGLDVISRDHGS